MAISKETEADILRYHFVEKWKVGTIASQLFVHHSVVDRVISQAGQPKVERATQPTMVDPYLPFVIETLDKFPKLSAARLYDMVKERGYPGQPSYFRQRIAEIRPRPQPEAYLRLKTLPGEQAQVDWGHFGHITIGTAKRPLMAFVMVLSWSRQIFLRFYLNQQIENFLRGHVEAFERWRGLPKVLLYDNLKSAVLERRGDAIRFHPTMLELSAHYRYEPRPVAVARGNEKGRVERAIRYIRDNFFAGRDWQELDDLNKQADAWCLGRSADRPCPEDGSMTVREAFIQEQTQLSALPETPFPTEERQVLRSGKTPYIRFDQNDYSIPFTHVRRPLNVVATLETIQILDGSEVIAEHARSFARREQIEDAEHIDALIERKHQARCHRSVDRLSHAAPSSQKLLKQAAERGQPLARFVKQLEQLLDEYGAGELECAISEALAQQVPHINAVQQVLETTRELSQQPPPIGIKLSDKANSIAVRAASLASYDALHTIEDKEND